MDLFLGGHWFKSCLGSVIPVYMEASLISFATFIALVAQLGSTDRMNGNGTAAVGLGKLPVKLIKIACVFVTQLISIGEVYRLHIRSST